MNGTASCDGPHLGYPLAVPPRRPADWIPRPALSGLLSSEHAVVALVGPRGSGRSSLLADWALARTDVHWVEDDVVPRVTSGVLVVDDAERAPAALWAEVDRTLDRNPDVRLRVATTRAGVLPGHWRVEVVDDLHLDRAAVADYLSAAGSALDPALVRLVSDGHPESVRRVSAVTGSTTRQLRGALAVNASEALDPELALMALPDHLTPEVVGALGGPEEFLDRAELDGIGWWQGEPGARVFRLVPVVREATRAALGAAPAHRRRHLLAAEALLEHGASFPAFREAVLADDLALADRALKQGGMALLGEHGLAVMELLRPVSDARLRRYPALAMALALTFNARATHRLRALELFGVVLVGSRLGAGRPIDRVLLRTLESAALRVIGVGDGGLKSARKAVQLLGAVDPQERDDLGRLGASVHNHLGVSLFRAGAEDESRTQFELALTLHPDRSGALMARGGLALLDAVRGEVNRARDQVEAILSETWPVEVLDEYAGSPARMAQAQVALDDLDFDTAEQALDTIWPIIDTIEHWPLLAHQRAVAEVGRGRPGVALEGFRAVRRARTGRFGTAHAVQEQLDHTEALLLVATGDLLAARRMLSAGRTGHRLTRALVHLCTDDDQAALELLARSRATRPRDRLRQCALEAIVLHRLGHHDQSRARAGLARDLVHTHGVRSPLLVLPSGGEGLFDDLVPAALLGQVSSRTVPVLTPRERVVLGELARTGHLPSIAAALQVSDNTVKSQRRALYRKLGVASREEALAAAIEHGLLDD